MLSIDHRVVVRDDKTVAKRGSGAAAIYPPIAMLMVFLKKSKECVRDVEKTENSRFPTLGAGKLGVMGVVATTTVELGAQNANMGFSECHVGKRWGSGERRT